VALANYFVEASVSLSGPPSIFSKAWRKPPRWVDLPFAGPPSVPAVLQGPDEGMRCAVEVSNTGAETRGGGTTWQIFNPYNPTDPENTFVRLGLDSSDKVIAIDGKPITNTKDWLSALVAGHGGKRVVFAVLRAGQQFDVPLDKKKLDSLFEECPAP